MNQEIAQVIDGFSNFPIPDKRKVILDALAKHIRQKSKNDEVIRLNFICTHNSRRSHLAQVWAQTLAFHFGINKVFCYSGGTESTSVYPKVIETIEKQGFAIQVLSEGKNPLYAVKYDMTENPIICFSKIYRDAFNPNSDFTAVMTCSDADEECPLVLGAEARFQVTFEDPKIFDQTSQVDQKYLEKSQEIGAELYYVFAQLIK